VQKYSSTLSLTSALDGDSWSAPGLGRFNPGKKTRHPLHTIMCGPRTVQDGGWKSSPYRDSIPGSFSPQRVAILATPKCVCNSVKWIHVIYDD